LRKVTQQDIAEALGVSKFAVSRALADKPGVGAETRADVLAKAEALGYRRGAARARDEKAEVLFVFGSPGTVQGGFWIRILQGAQEEAQRRGVRTGLHFVSGADDLSGISKRVAGMVLSGPLDEEVFEVAARLHIPLVRTSVGPLLDRIDRVMLADYESGMAAAEHLVGLGHRRAIYAEGTPNLRGRAERLRGFRQGFPTPVDSLTFDERVGIGPALDRLLAAGEMPTAIFCASDGVGVNAVSELVRRGLAVPGDVSVVGYLDDPAATQIAPALTTVRVPVRNMGITIMRCLLDRMNAADPDDLPPRRIQLIPEFVVRQSTGPAPRQPVVFRPKDQRARVPAAQTA
jgi:LacI family transcriptional regulator